jgi:hypothetical protein
MAACERGGKYSEHKNISCSMALILSKLQWKILHRQRDEMVIHNFNDKTEKVPAL